MKKKLYMTPATEIVKVEVAKMIAASDSLGIGTPVDSASGAESRSGEYSWDDDEE